MLEVMSLHLGRCWPWILALLPAFGCVSKDLRTVITEHRPKVEAQLAKVNAIRETLRATPAVTVDDVTIPGPPPRIGVTDVDEHANVAIEYVEDLEDLNSWGAVPFRIMGSGSMNRCAAALSTHRYVYDPIVGTVPTEIPWYTADDHFKHCEGVRYLFVIRSLAYVSPTVVRESSGPCPEPSSGSGADAGAPDAGPKSTAKCKVYDGGYLQAEVIVFDVQNGTRLGGFRFSAESSPRLDIGLSSDSAALQASDFAFKIRSAFNEAAQQNVPSFSVGN